MNFLPLLRGSTQCAVGHASGGAAGHRACTETAGSAQGTVASCLHRAAWPIEPVSGEVDSVVLASTQHPYLRDVRLLLSLPCHRMGLTGWVLGCEDGEVMNKLLNLVFMASGRHCPGCGKELSC
jgi:hypothetical protein